MSTLNRLHRIRSTCSCALPQKVKKETRTGLIPFLRRSDARAGPAACAAQVSVGIEAHVGIEGCGIHCGANSSVAVWTNPRLLNFVTSAR
jgi:hypothetical protein